MTTEEAPSSGRPAISDSDVIERFGGIRPMATKLGVAVTTVQGWKERGHIPAARWQQITAAAAAHGIELGPSAAAEQAAPAAAPQPAKAASRAQAAPEPPADEAPGEEPELTEPAAAAAPAEPAAGPRRAAPGVAWLALVVAVAVAVAVLTRPYWESMIHRGGSIAGGGDPAALARIAAELESTNQVLNRLERDMTARSSAMAERVGALEAGGGEAGATFARQLSELGTQMAELSNAFEAVSGGTERVAQRIAALESAQGRIPEPVQRELTELVGQLESLRAGFAALEASFKAEIGTVAKASAALETRVTELETRPVQTGEKIAALALAIGQVEAALDSGKPYRAALDRLYELGREDPVIVEGGAMAALDPWADSGIPDRLALQRRFVEITPQMGRALLSTEEETWLDSVWNSLKGLVTIRRVDGDGELSPVSRAEIAMERGDLAAAVAAFAGAGSLGPDGNAWLAQVEARLAAEREIEALYGQVIAPLAGTAGTGGQ
ncbi:MAG: hypothetical protein JSU82_14010 [Rhodospirillales bacterium]|nr:MAG: hypothetical protein JSU82_14010 [Rhodospirillales bacterium]